MRITNYLAGAALLLSSTAVIAQTTRPSAVPEVTITADTKLLIFDWKPVPGATYYQLYVNVDGHSGYSKTGAQIPAPGTRAGYSIATHLQHWQDALFRLSACNSAGCRDSKSLFPRRHMLETIGYFKASNADRLDDFGNTVALSADGSTMAVTSSSEQSKARGINGNQADNSFFNGSGAVYVYRKVNGSWRQEAYIKAPDNVQGLRFGESLALSSNGSTLVASSIQDSITPPGQVFTYVRASNGTWSLLSTLLAPDSRENDGFGESVNITDDGNTLKVAGFGNPDSSGVTGSGFGRSYLFARTATSWRLLQSIDPYVSGDYCRSTRLSRDGSTMIAFCAFNDNRNSRAVTYKRAGDTWQHVSDFLVGTTSGGEIALNTDATVLALCIRDAFYTSVHLYHWAGAAWTSDQLIRPPAQDNDGYANFGSRMAFDGAGTLLAVGSPSAEPPAPAGVSESLAAGASTMDGAVVLFDRGDGAIPWEFRSLVKAPNPDRDDLFGIDVALSASGRTLAVGASLESGSARGINGDQNNNATAAGAVYLY